MKPKSSPDPRPGAQLQAMRKNRRGGRSTGRPRVPTYCGRCGTKCPSAREAWEHCQSARGESALKGEV